MPVISARRVKARTLKSCANCRKTIHEGEHYIRAYGYAHSGDPRYAISLHVACAGTDTVEKLRGPDTVAS